MSFWYLEKPYKSSNGHTVTQEGRLLFKVTSASRPLRIVVENGKKKEKGIPPHTVDLETRDGQPIKDIEYARCDCENAHYAHARPCRHVLAVFEALEDAIVKVTKTVRREHERAKVRTYKLDKTKTLK